MHYVKILINNVIMFFQHSILKRNSSFILNSNALQQDKTKFISCLKQDDSLTSDNSNFRKLMKSIQETDRGLKTSRSQMLYIENIVDEIASHSTNLITNDEIQSGTWKLLYTTEKLVLFIIKNANWFGTQVGDIYQVVDVKNEMLQNVITFPPDGAFVVDSNLITEGEKRVNFKFKSSQLQIPDNKIIKIPPFGQGWFDNLYINDTYRVTKDIRNDILIAEKVGPPKNFVK